MKTDSPSTDLQQSVPDDKVAFFFLETQKELGLTSTKKLARLVTRIFSGIRRSLTTRETASFLQRMPSLLQLLFVSNWKYDEKEQRIEHLDELVESIYQDDRNSESPLFRSEIETLNAVIIILRKLDKMMGILNFEGFKFSLVQEIKQVALEDAAA